MNTKRTPPPSNNNSIPDPAPAPNIPNESTPRNFSRRKNGKRLALDDPEAEDPVIVAVSELNSMVLLLLNENKILKKELLEVKDLLKYVVGNTASASAGNNVPGKCSYASVTKMSNKVVVINPSKDDVSSTTTRQALKDKLVASNYKLRGLSNTRKGGVVVQCVSSEERNKLKNDAAAELGADFVVSAPVKRLPRVRIFGFTEEYNADNFLSILKDQNPNIFDNEYCTIKVEHIYFVKSKERFGAKLEVDPSTFKKLMALEKVFIRWDSCWVNEDLNIRRCYKCCGFNHISSKCSAKDQRCPNCGGCHQANNCESSLPKCPVCCDAIKSRHLDIDTNHSALSSSCPSYIHRADLERRRIDYGTDT